MEGTMNQHKYASVFVQHIHPYMQVVFPQSGGINQQDSVKCHTVQSIQAWSEKHQYEFTVLPWWANFPDLNPIKNL